MKKDYFRFLLAGMLTLTFAFFPRASFSIVIYVNLNAGGASNGSNWTDAFTSLQDALEVASAGDVIWVAHGIYTPVEIIDLNGSGGLDPREAVFVLPEGVALYGGFTGTEGALEERNWNSNLTILSGDIDNNDLNADGNYIAEAPGHVVGNNSYHVLFTENVSASTRLDGFIVTAGKADIGMPVAFDDPNLDGGGWYNRPGSPGWSSSPTIINTTFTGNYAESEGGAYYSAPGPAGGESSSLIENCLFSGNESNNTAGAVYIGSFNPGSYQPVFMNCRFFDNKAFRRGGAIYLVGDNAEITSSKFENNMVTAVSEDMSTLPGSGGAASLVASNAIFTSCMFQNNSATGNPTGAFEGGGGGAVYISVNEPQTTQLGASAPQFNGCGFYKNTASGNTAAWGGALVFLSDAGILEPRFINCVFSENTAQNHGGAVAGFTRVISDPEGFNPSLEPEYTNCTFFGNEAGQLGGAVYHSGYNYMGSQILESVIENSILWGNSAVTDGDEIYSTGNQFISYSLVEGSGGSGGGWNAALGIDGGNNLDGNAGFVNQANPVGADNIPATNDDGLRLTQFSDALNSGNNLAAGLSGITEDYTGSPRIFGSVVDMGAYERAGIILPDFDFVWLLDWPDVEPPCLTCPFPWSFLLFHDFGFEPQYIWKEPAKFIRTGNSAVITGEIINFLAPEISFNVYLELDREHTWKTWSRQQGSWFSETGEAQAIAQTGHIDWKFWKLSTKSYLEGTGEIQGILKLKQWNSSGKTGFQMGMGANAWDGDFGLAGYFNYNGKLEYQGKKLQVKGLGSMNVDGEPCEADCEQQFRHLTVNNNLRFNKNAAIQVNNFSESPIHIYPVPAGEFLMLESAIPGNGISVVKIIDSSGRIVYTGQWNRKENKFTIDLHKLVSGLHIVKVESGNSADTFTGRFVRR